MFDRRCWIRTDFSRFLLRRFLDRLSRHRVKRIHKICCYIEVVRLLTGALSSWVSNPYQGSDTFHTTITQ